MRREEVREPVSGAEAVGVLTGVMGADVGDVG
jgi:hypothetical protein